ncbi:MAG: HD domain-containing phosphohydrolase [Planctomycetota bacterium]
MRRLSRDELVAGITLRGDIVSRSGAKLLAAGTELTPQLASALRQQTVDGIFTSAPVPTPAVHLRHTSIAPGDAAESPFSDVDDPEREKRRARAQLRRGADRVVAERSRKWEALPKVIPSSPKPVVAAAGTPEVWPSQAELRGLATRRRTELRELLMGVIAGVRTSVEPFLTLVEELIDLAAAHPARFAELPLLQPSTGGSLEEHADRVAALCVGVAIRLRWSRTDVQLAGLAGMLADVGMALMPLEVRSSPGPLDEFAHNRVMRHPAYSVSLLAQVDGLPEAVLLAAHQHHEREDGLGYPWGVRGRRLSDVARVIAACDVLVASAARRPYRGERRPYDALIEVINQASRGSLNRRIVRALVAVTGLFPPASHVLLSTGEIARVESISAERIDRPVVQPLSVSGRAAGTPIDLSADRAIRVVRAADPPREPRVRWVHTAPQTSRAAA